MSAGIAVLGAGLMGHGIAQVFAAAGHEVAVYDSVAATLDTVRSRVRRNLIDLGHDTGAADRIKPCADLGDAVRDADFVVEAALEDLALKRTLLARAEVLAHRRPVMASNTSVIPITHIAEALEGRERMLGTHWWNPPYLIPLVEVIGTAWTDPAVLDWTVSLHAALGKTPVHVRRDVPGFIGNRLQHALWREAVALVAEGVCDARTVDIVVKSSFGMRLAVLGPLENADLVGTDLTAAIHAIVLPHLDRGADAHPYLADLVATGRLGMKSGEGFRTWTAAEQAGLRAALLHHLMRDAAPRETPP